MTMNKKIVVVLGLSILISGCLNASKEKTFFLMTTVLISKDLKIISPAKKEINFILLTKLLLPKEAMNLEKYGKTER